MSECPVLIVQYWSTWPVYCQSRKNKRGKNYTWFPAQRLKPLLRCSILRKQVTVCFPFVRIKQPSGRLTLAALRQGQKNTARAAEPGGEDWGSNPIGSWTADGHVGCSKRVNILFDTYTNMLRKIVSVEGLQLHHTQAIWDENRKVHCKTCSLVRERITW